jgi:hypothetical protein
LLKGETHHKKFLNSNLKTQNIRKKKEEKIKRKRIKELQGVDCLISGLLPLSYLAQAQFPVSSARPKTPLCAHAICLCCAGPTCQPRARCRPLSSLLRARALTSTWGLSVSAICSTTSAWSSTTSDDFVAGWYSRPRYKMSRGPAPTLPLPCVVRALVNLSPPPHYHHLGHHRSEQNLLRQVPLPPRVQATANLRSGLSIGGAEGFAEAL